MRLFYCDHFELPLPDHHRFPMAKYRLLRERIAQSAKLAPLLLEAESVSRAALLLAHEERYVTAVEQGELSREAIRALGFPWSPELVERSKRSCGATVNGARYALEHGYAVNLAGGTHHAFTNRPQGYCVFNDAAVAARTVIAEARAKHILICDLDVHQGNGTAQILADDDQITTLSIHGGRNFPLQKERSHIDVGLPDETTDETYLDAVETALSQAARCGQPDLVLFNAGADPYRKDRLGRLSLSKQGLRKRDELVLAWATKHGAALVAMMGGGYSPVVDDIVDIHQQTVWTVAMAAGILDRAVDELAIREE